MKLTFTYDPAREIIPLKAGFRSTNSSQHTELARRAEAANIAIEDTEAVAKLSATMLEEASLDVSATIATYQGQWDGIQVESVRKLQTLFQTAWDPGDVTAYLTVSARCPYNVKQRFFFISCFKTTPMRTCLHELQHFYTHKLLEPIFITRGKAGRFNEFKESLTVLLNELFIDIIEEPDEGYPQHSDSRQRILDDFHDGRSLLAIAEQW